MNTIATLVFALAHIIPRLLFQPKASYLGSCVYVYRNRERACLRNQSYLLCSSGRLYRESRPSKPKPSSVFICLGEGHWPGFCGASSRRCDCSIWRLLLATSQRLNLWWSALLPSTNATSTSRNSSGATGYVTVANRLLLYFLCMNPWLVPWLFTCLISIRSHMHLSDVTNILLIFFSIKLVLNLRKFLTIKNLIGIFQ